MKIVSDIHTLLGRINKTDTETVRLYFHILNKENILKIMPLLISLSYFAKCLINMLSRLLDHLSFQHNSGGYTYSHI
jgi:hypothetical protein